MSASIYPSKGFKPKTAQQYFDFFKDQQEKISYLLNIFPGLKYELYTDNDSKYEIITKFSTAIINSDIKYEISHNNSVGIYILFYYTVPYNNDSVIINYSDGFYLTYCSLLKYTNKQRNISFPMIKSEYLPAFTDQVWIDINLALNKWLKQFPNATINFTDCHDKFKIKQLLAFQ